MSRIAHVLALINAVLGLAVLFGWLDLSAEEIAAVMSVLAIAGAAVGSFFDPKVPWWGPVEPPAG